MVLHHWYKSTQWKSICLLEMEKKCFFFLQIKKSKLSLKTKGKKSFILSGMRMTAAKLNWDCFSWLHYVFSGSNQDCFCSIHVSQITLSHLYFLHISLLCIIMPDCTCRCFLLNFLKMYEFTKINQDKKRFWLSCLFMSWCYLIGVIVCSV